METQSTDGTAQQTSNTSAADTFVYAPVPTLGTPSPASGPTLGGNTVTLNGTGFESTNGTGANFATTHVTVAATTITSTPCPGTPSAPCYTINSATQIVVKDFPPRAAGGVTITVTTVGGTSTGAPYTYVALPTVTSVSPSSGPTAGGNSVTVTGTAFDNATDVFIAGNDIPSSAFTVNGAGTQISVAHWPAHAAGGPFDVTVETPAPGGTSTPSSGDQYTYVPAPTVSSVAPDAGPTGGGNTIIVTGTAFTGTTDVLVGSNDITASPCSGSPSSPCFTVNGGGTQITIEDMPALTSGPALVDIVVTTPDGSNNTTPADTYVYAPVPTITSVSPPAGVLAGGNTINIVGTGFQSSNGGSADYGVTAVNVGATAVDRLSGRAVLYRRQLNARQRPDATRVRRHRQCDRHNTRRHERCRVVHVRTGPDYQQHQPARRPCRRWNDSHNQRRGLLIGFGVHDDAGECRWHNGERELPRYAVLHGGERDSDHRRGPC